MRGPAQSKHCARICSRRWGIQELTPAFPVQRCRLADAISCCSLWLPCIRLRCLRECIQRKINEDPMILQPENRKQHRTVSDGISSTSVESERIVQALNVNCSCSHMPTAAGPLQHILYPGASRTCPSLANFCSAPGLVMSLTVTDWTRLPDTFGIRAHISLEPHCGLRLTNVLLAVPMEIQRVRLSRPNKAVAIRGVCGAYDRRPVVQGRARCGPFR